ncbi:dihydroxyacetone kinase subunit DhaL [Staphylococcus borealis]|uniref:dihydroxyacetone kinase subunit DhaL n=1 Tax=Staphylococcus borealis TaxID=2742203 RepID=UPI000D1F57DB|nr:dihydroxyacetone kinase subunit DhaL [Staphylococcus borealis]PTK67149.1 dihydroxyacetone kinase subunit L [Staphylococcus borealis]RIO72259.1 dihydroxyacetone kinase subunit L [Staphylococcus borealis]
MDIKEMKQRLLDLETTFSEKETVLTDLDRVIGDGDHGVNMLRGFKSLKDKLDDSSMASLFKTTGMALMSNIGGASGPLYGFSFVKMSNVVKDDIDNDNLKAVVTEFANAIAQRGKVQRNEKTMFDVVDRAREALENEETLTFEVLQQFATDTKTIEATKGRAAYFKKDSIGYVDPGAQSMVYILSALIGDDIK